MEEDAKKVALYSTLLNVVLVFLKSSLAFLSGSSAIMAVKKILDKSYKVITEFHDQALGEVPNVEEAIIEMAQRRPLTIIDIANVLGISEANAEKWVNGLKEAGKLKERQYNEIKYYSCPLG
jgi:hypothetical protein